MTKRQIRYQLNKEKEKKYSRKYRVEHPEQIKAYNKKMQKQNTVLINEYHKKYPERRKAERIFSNAIRYGKILRKPCMVCSNPKSHGHHEDYSKPLEVVWLCAKHHKAVHYNIV